MWKAEDDVILVDANDREIGVARKSVVHREGLLHRAFSVFLFDDSGRLLTQRRALDKYHSGGRWANSCCGHPRPGELTQLAAERRVTEELGVFAQITEVGSFIYRADVSVSLIEHEIDHVFIGGLRGDLSPDPREICGLASVPVDELRKDLDRRPARYAAWLAGALLVALGAPTQSRLDLRAAQSLAAPPLRNRLPS